MLLLDFFIFKEVCIFLCMSVICKLSLVDYLFRWYFGQSRKIIKSHIPALHNQHLQVIQKFTIRTCYNGNGCKLLLCAYNVFIACNNV